MQIGRRGIAEGSRGISTQAMIPVNLTPITRRLG